MIDITGGVFPSRNGLAMWLTDMTCKLKVKKTKKQQTLVVN